MKGSWLLVLTCFCHVHGFNWPWGSVLNCPPTSKPPNCNMGDQNYPFYPHPTDEKFFIHCRAYSPICKQCAPGTVWNQKLRTCTAAAPPGNNPCPAPNPDNNHSVLVPHPSKPHQYYHCIDGVPHLRECPPDMAFDPHTSSCVSVYWEA